MMPFWRDNLSDPRTLLLLAALVLALLATVLPPLPKSRNGVDVLAVVDITGSMNVRDYKLDGTPASRLAVAKHALKETVADLPCPSRLGLALFTERVPFLLFEPIDVCKDYGALAAAIDSIDWREAWQGDSHVATGYLHAIEMAKSLGSDLVFITDGQEAPPLPSTAGPTFDGKKGEVKGLILGAGGYTPSQIPKFNDHGDEIGFYQPDDVPNESRFGPPPADAESRPGYEPRNAPFGAVAAKGNEYLSSVREPYLKSLAEQTGQVYAHMDGAGSFASTLVANAKPRPSRGHIDLRWIPGIAALLALLGVFAVLPLRERFLHARSQRLQEI